MTQRQPRKDDDMPWKRRPKANETRQAKKQREVPPLELGMPGEKPNPWRSRETAKRLWTRESTVATTRTFHGNGGAEESTYDNGLPIGRHISSVSTTKKLLCGLRRA